MIRRPRRAYMLVQIITWLPLIAAGTTIAFMISAQSLRLQARERAQIATESVMQDLVRRIRLDVRAADQLAVAPDGPEAMPTALDVVTRKGRITYQVKDGTVIRAETGGDALGGPYTWALGNCSLVFRIERMGASPGVLWMTFIERVPRDRTGNFSERFSTAALAGEEVRR